MNGKLIKISKPMISARELRKMWPGISLEKIIQGIDDANNKTNPDVINKKCSMIDFPKPFYHVKTIYIDKQNADKEIKYCKECEINYKNNDEYTPPYKARIKNGKQQYYIKRILFKIEDVKEYEIINPYVLYDNKAVNEIIKNTEKQSQHVPHKRLPIRQKTVSLLCGVSESTVRNWDNERYKPAGYPGRHEPLVLGRWAIRYRIEKQALREKSGVQNAQSINPQDLDKMNLRHYFAGDDSEEYDS